MIREFDKFLLDGSRLLLLTDEAEARACVERECAGVANTRIECRDGSPTALETLEAVGVRELRPRDRPHPRWPRRPARRRPHAGHPAAPARHRRPQWGELLDRQRDARRAQPPAGGGDAGRRRDRQRQDHQPDADPDLGDPRALPGLQRALLRARAARSTCGRPSDYVEPGRETGYATVVEAARRRGSARSATASGRSPTIRARNSASASTRRSRSGSASAAGTA